MLKKFQVVFVLMLILGIALPVRAAPLAAPGDITFTILHTNDFHGTLEEVNTSTTKYPGAARLATFIKGIRTTVGADNLVLFDGGDIMQGSLLSNLYNGESTMAYYNDIGYKAATFGNHEFDWGQTILADRVAQADFPFVAANLVQGSCTDLNNWTPSALANPYELITVGTAPNTVTLGVIGVTTTETPSITKVEATQGLCFRDPFDSIAHYYAEVDAASDIIVVLSHLGNTDSGGGYGLPVYGDQTLAKKLVDSNRPVAMIVGGHSHSNITPPPYYYPNSTAAVKTLVVQSHSNGRQVNRADFVYTPGSANGTVPITWTKTVIDMASANDPATVTLLDTFRTPEYLALISEPVGWITDAITRNYYGDAQMGRFINDMIYTYLQEDAVPANDADVVFNNAGGLRSDIGCAVYPCNVTYGQMFNVLPFGNQTLVGDMTGAQLLEVLNQSASLNKGSLQVSGIRFKFYRYNNGTPGANGPDDLPLANTWAWGAYDICVYDHATPAVCQPLDPKKTYRVATNDFLAPGGQDGFLGFKYITNYAVYGDMLNLANAAFEAHHGSEATAYVPGLDGRVTREGDNLTGPITPITILHHNDSHGNLLPTMSSTDPTSVQYAGYTQLVTLITQQRAFNPSRTLLVSSGDNIQGDAMMYYFKTAPMGVTSNGTPIADPSMHINPLIKAFNAVGYDAYVLGNHEFNFGSEVFVENLKQADFPVLQANLVDTGAYGVSEAGVLPYTVKSVGPEGIDVAILGIGNHRVPNYELPSNIPGLTFPNPISTAASWVPTLDRVYDVVVALTHIGFTGNPGSVEIDTNVDTELAAQVDGIDAIIGGHSHTDPSRKTAASGTYHYLPSYVAGPDGAVLVTQANRYNSYLGVVVLGMRQVSGKWQVASTAGKYIPVAVGKSTSNPAVTAEDAATKAIILPYSTLLTAYTNTEIGETTVPLDATAAFTQETNAANLQADASVWELAQHGITVDFHISGAMTDKKAPVDPSAGSPPITYPYMLKIADMFTLMQYENSLVTLNINGPQLKAILERGYRNYWYYKNTPSPWGGYSHYTTCMLDTNAGSKIVYRDAFPNMPDGNNVAGFYYTDPVEGVKMVDFADATTFYHVSTVNYLAAGSCNFNDSGVTLWPLNQIQNDTQFYVRDAVINYIAAQTAPISPAIEGRLVFATIRAWLAIIFK